jgi:hypothetical protein
MKDGGRQTKKKGRKSPPTGSSSSARTIVLWVLGLAGVILTVVLGRWALDERMRANRIAARAVVSFLKVDAPTQLPKYGEHEAYLFFENGRGGNDARGFHSDNAELLLISADRRTCDVLQSPNVSIPTDVGPGQTWNVRIAVDAASIRDKGATAEYRGSLEYIAGFDEENKEITAIAPFCQRLVYDRSADRVRWVSCLGEPPPACTKFTG